MHNGVRRQIGSQDIRKRIGADEREFEVSIPPQRTIGITPPLSRLMPLRSPSGKGYLPLLGTANKSSYPDAIRIATRTIGKASSTPSNASDGRGRPIPISGRLPMPLLSS